MLKYIIGALVLAAVVPALLPNHYSVERSIKIELPKEDIYSYLVNLEDWKQWSPWIEKEPSAEQKFFGIPGVVGSTVEWKGETIGSGKQTLTVLREPDYLEMNLEFVEPSPSQAVGYFELNEAEVGTIVTWGIKGKLSYPLERLMGPFMGLMIGPDFKRGLERLKERLEQPNP